jgi:hypothetical protein
MVSWYIYTLYIYSVYHIYLYVYVYHIYIYICVCVCVRETERELFLKNTLDYIMACLLKGNGSVNTSIAGQQPARRVTAGNRGIRRNTQRWMELMEAVFSVRSVP